jgi:predicted DCC family thiol-disulfide oxidoreductase YuxK
MLGDLPKDKMIILFDGVCNFCDSTVQFIIKHDPKDVFRFAPIQSAIGEEIIRHLHVDTTKIDSILLYEPEKGHFYKSEAAIRIARALGGIYSFVGIFSVLPRSLTDIVYDYIARNRYRWYGQKTECMIPTAEMIAKFLG